MAIGDVLIGVVCDGAGSASGGQQGAQFFARRLTELIAQSRMDEDFAGDAQPDCGKSLPGIIQCARSELEQIARSEQRELRDFACTVVGCILSPSGGCFFHIGDGFAICVRENGQTLLSQPENGEYSDETYFVTDERWSDHLRMTPIPEINPGCLIGLMSDGASPFAVNRTRTGFFRPFLDPVMNFLSSATEHNGNRALQNVLEDEKTFAITTDDKTLLLALAA